MVDTFIYFRKKVSFFSFSETAYSTKLFELCVGLALRPCSNTCLLQVIESCRELYFGPKTDVIILA